MMLLWKTLVAAVILCLMHIASAKRNSVTYCGACLGLIEEMNWAVATTDPKKKIQIGSFRIDPQGKQDLREIPLARSEVHLTELMETICNHLSSYVASIDSKGHTNYYRTASRDGTPISMKHSTKDQDTQKFLKFSCEALIEDFEDDLVELYKEGKEEGLSERMCVDRAGVCQQHNVTELAAAVEEAKAAGLREQEEERLKKLENEDDDEDEDDDDDDDTDVDTQSDNAQDSEHVEL